MEIRHGALAIDVPSDWQDQSTLLFVKPRDPELLATTNSVTVPTEAVSVTFVIDDGEPREILARQANAFAKADPSFELLDEGSFATRLGEGWSYEQRLDMGGTIVRQLAVACGIGKVVVLATGAAVDGRFERSREQLTAILASLTLGGSS